MIKNNKSKKTEIGKIPEDWEVKELGEVCQLVKKQYNPSKKDVRTYIGLEHIEQQNLKLISIGSSEDIDSNKFEFKAGQILFGKLRPYFRKVYRPKFDGVCSTDIWVIDSKDQFDNGFLFYFLADQRIINEASNSSEGTRMPRARWDYLSRLSFAFPSISEQHAIASILSSLDSKIALNRAMNATLESIGQALFKHWFIDFEFPNEEGKPYKSSGGEMANSELGAVPKGWMVGTLGALGEFKNGVNYSREETGNTMFSIINVRDLVANNFILESTTDKINMDFEKAKDYLLKEGDIVIARSASPGETIFIFSKIPNLIYSGFSIRYRPSDLSYANYFFCILQNLKESLFNISDGTTLKNINQETLKGVKLIVPDNKTLSNYNMVISAIYERIIMLLNENQNLSQIRDALLPKLMSGEIRIKDAENFKEDDAL